MRTREDVLNILNDSLPELRKCGVREIGVFGSVARRDQNQESDIDILVTWNIIRLIRTWTFSFIWRIDWDAALIS